MGRGVHVHFSPFLWCLGMWLAVIPYRFQSPLDQVANLFRKARAFLSRQRPHFRELVGVHSDDDLPFAAGSLDALRGAVRSLLTKFHDGVTNGRSGLLSIYISHSFCFHYLICGRSHCQPEITVSVFRTFYCVLRSGYPVCVGAVHLDPLSALAMNRNL